MTDRDRLRIGSSKSEGESPSRMMIQVRYQPHIRASQGRYSQVVEVERGPVQSIQTDIHVGLWLRLENIPMS